MYATTAVPARETAPSVGPDMPTLVLNHFPFVVGRHEECDLPIEDRRISRRHCQFFLNGRLVWLQDLSSGNGTYLNGKKVTLPFIAQTGDVLRLDRHSYRLKIEHPAVSNDPFGR